MKRRRFHLSVLRLAGSGGLLGLFGRQAWGSPAFPATPAALPQEYDRYGGWRALQGSKTGFFHTQQINGRWWLVDPDGNVFLSKGVCSVHPRHKRDAPALAPEAWAEWAGHAAQQLRSWNFNTVELSERAWVAPPAGGPANARGVHRSHGSDVLKRLPEMAYTVILNLAAAQRPDVWRKGIVLDYFSPEFREAVERETAKLCPPLAGDPWLLGYYTDTELKWFPDIRGTDTVLQSFLKMPPASPGHQRALAFLKGRGRTPATLNAWDELDFLQVAAAQYGRVCTEAVRRHDPHHLILGMKFNEHAPIPLSRGLGPYFDALSLDIYEARAPLYKLSEMHRLSGKPTLITEFSFKAMDSGNPNTVGAGEPVMTQQDRADLYAAYVRDLANLPSCIGYTWFDYRDQPKASSGRSPGGFGAENSNYGLVRLDGTPWPLLTERMTKMNGAVEALHARSRNPSV